MNLPFEAPAPEEKQKKKTTQVKEHVKIQDDNRQKKTTNKVKNDDSKQSKELTRLSCRGG